MKKIFTKFGLNSLCLMSFILLCGTFTCEKAFSQKLWDKYCVGAYYDEDYENAVIFLILTHHTSKSNFFSYFSLFKIEYAKADKKYFHLMSGEAKSDNKKTKTSVLYKGVGERIQFTHCIKPRVGTFWAEEEERVNVQLEPTSGIFWDVNTWVFSTRSRLRVRWYTPEPRENFKYVRIKGFWINNGTRQIINHEFPIEYLNLNRNQN